VQCHGVAGIQADMYKWMFLSGKLESKSACTPSFSQNCRIQEIQSKAGEGRTRQAATGKSSEVHSFIHDFRDLFTNPIDLFV
jgi:hypothetical protein